MAPSRFRPPPARGCLRRTVTTRRNKSARFVAGAAIAVCIETGRPVAPRHGRAMLGRAPHGAPVHLRLPPQMTSPPQAPSKSVNELTSYLGGLGFRDADVVMTDAPPLEVVPPYCRRFGAPRFGVAGFQPPGFGHPRLGFPPISSGALHLGPLQRTRHQAARPRAARARMDTYRTHRPKTSLLLCPDCPRTADGGRRAIVGYLCQEMPRSSGGDGSFKVMKRGGAVTWRKGRHP